MKRSIGRHGFTLLLAVGVLILLMRQIDWRAIPGTLAQLPPGVLLLSFLGYLLLVVTKAWRFGLILRLPISLRRLAPIIALQTFWTNLLPMRTGDLSYVYLLRRDEHVSAHKGAASLLFGSIVDMLLMLVLLSGLGARFYPRFETALSLLTLSVLPALAALALILLALPALFAPGWMQARIRSVGDGIGGWFSRHSSEHARQRTLLLELGRKVEAFLTELTRRPSNRLLLQILGASVMSIGLRFGLQWYLLRGMQIELGLAEVYFALAFTGFCNLLPIQSFAGLGTVEAPWAWALVGLGVPGERAIVSGFSLHLVILLYSVLTGMIGWGLRVGIDEESPPRPPLRAN